jgi:hypothetical protein
MELAGVLLQGVLLGLASPMVALPAALLGWFARRPWQAVLGGVAVGVALFALSFRHTLPEGASIVWAAVPLGLVAPVLWALAGFLLGSWRRARGRRGSAPALWERLLGGLLGGVVGGLLGALVGYGAGVLYVELASVSNFEGQAGYAVVFGFALPGLVLGALAGLVLGWRWDSRRQPPSGRPPHPAPPR